MYAKLFASVFEGSMRGQSDVLLVWFNMLAHAPAGVCDRTPKTISEETGLSLERVQAAILVLESPDPQSRSPDEQGRRVLRLSEHRDWGWKLVNWEYYRKIMSEADRRMKDADRQRKHRESKTSDGCHGMSQQPVTARDKNVTGVTPASASASVQGGGEGGGEENAKYHKDARTVLFLLSEGSGKHFREVDSNLSVISARLNEPEVNLDGVRLMIGRQCRLWKGTTMEEYLRPQTLFGKQKFDGYYAARGAKINEPNAKPQVNRDKVW